MTYNMIREYRDLLHYQRDLARVVKMHDAADNDRERSLLHSRATLIAENIEEQRANFLAAVGKTACAAMLAIAIGMTGAALYSNCSADDTTVEQTEQEE